MTTVYFICDLFDGAVNISEYTLSNDRMTNEFEKIWKEVAMM
jgi:hypothetical protein